MRKFDLKEPIHRVGQSLVYYDQLDSIEEKCRSMQGVKGIDGTVIFSDRVKGEWGESFEPNCSVGVILKPEDLTFGDKEKIAPVVAGALAQILPKHEAELNWPLTLSQKNRIFGKLGFLISKIKERWVYVILSAHFQFDESWDLEAQEAFLQDFLHAVDQADRHMRKEDCQALSAAYAEATGLIGRNVRVELNDRVLEGCVESINAKGELSVKPPKGRASRVSGKKVKSIEYLDVASE